MKSLHSTTQPLNASTAAKWYFEDPSHIDPLRREIIEWLEPPTPFREYSKAKGPGGGVDCIRLCEAIFVNIGFTDSFTFPKVPMDFTQHQDRSIILEFFLGQYLGPDGEVDPQSARLELLVEMVWARLTDVDLIPEPMPGDILCFKIGKAVNHLGIALEKHSEFVNCFRPAGVIVSSLKDHTFAERLTHIFRARASTPQRLNLSTS